jgi:hypothetical protein
MAVDWINDDGTFAEGWLDKANIPAEARDYAKGVKDIGSLVKRGVDTQREFTTRVKVPTEPAEREKFLTEHFGKDLTAREEARKAAEAQDAQKKQAAAAEDKVKAEKERVEKARKLLKDKHGDKFDTNLELVRRAFRSEHAPPWIKDGVAQAAGVEPAQITDEQIKEVVQTDPAVFETLLTIGNLTADGHTEHSDGHREAKLEVVPMQPKCPQLYQNRPDNDPEKQWFVKRGFDFATMTWNGQPL